MTFLAGCGAKVGTMSRRLSGIRFAHKMRDLPDPTATARVIAVWEGIRRTQGDHPLGRMLHRMQYVLVDSR